MPRILPLLASLFLAAHCYAQSHNRYGLPELGISVTRSEIVGSTGNLASAAIPTIHPFGAVVFLRAGVELDQALGVESVPIGAQISSDHGVSLDVGTPNTWMVSAFWDIEALEIPVESLRRPGLAVTSGLRGSYTFDLYNAGIELGRTAPLTFQGNQDLALPNGGGGNVVKLWGGVELPFTQQFEISARAELALADQAYNRTYFGVTAEQAVESGFTSFDPGAGLVYGSLMLRARYLINANWAVQSTGRVIRYLGEAEKSPIVEATSEWQTSIDLGVVYRF